MKRQLIPAIALIAAVFFLPATALAQTKTIVSATVLDPNGVPYAGGSVATQLVPTTGTPTINKVPVNVQNNPAAIDANGHFTVSLWCNTAGGACTPLDQSGTQWQFTITNPGAQPPVGFGGVSFTVSVTITGTTQDLSSTLSAASVLLYRDGGSSGGTCPGTGATGNLLFINSTNCGNSNEMNFNAGSDTLSLTPAIQTQTAATSLARSAPVITDTVGNASPVTPGSVTQRAAVTGTTDTILATDRGNRVPYNSTSAVAVTLPQAGSAGFAGGFSVRLSNQNTGTVTVTPTTSTINGNATLVILEGQDCFVTPNSTGANYSADCNEPQITAGTGISLTRGVHSLTISSSATSLAFSALTSGTNTGAAMVVGTGATLTISNAGALSQAGLLLNGTLLTSGGNGTTTFPYFYISQGAARTTLNTSGSEIVVNAPSGFAGSLMELGVNGANPVFTVSSTGATTSLAAIAAGASSTIGFFGRSSTSSSADGLILLRNNAGNGFTRLNFGGITSSFPSLQVNGATLQAELADGSAQTQFSASKFNTETNCANGASPAVCGSSSSGAVAIPAGLNQTLVVNTTAVAANSRILLTIDESLVISGTTCNTTLSTLTQPVVTARTAGTSFTMQLSGTTATNPPCVSYLVLDQ